MSRGAEIALKQCLGLKDNETCLIIADKEQMSIAQLFFEEAKKITKNAKLIETPVAKVNGEEPPQEIADEMKKHDVILIPTSKSLSHTKARREATEAGARIASMPGITEEMIERAITVDYNAMAQRTKKIADVLDNGSEVKITTESGTDISMSIDGKKAHGRSAGIFNKPGEWGNLPEGEACIAPVEGTSNGVFVVDESIARIGLVDNPVKVTVKEGFAVGIDGNASADELARTLQSVGKGAFNIAELGIGVNDKAKITGNVLEDEKVLGTAHIAFGNNLSMEGKVDVPLHIDCVFKKPTISVDGKIIIEEGELLI
ncbi:aminopeptidase [Candidatus Woesearchaeota archaeon]|nr:aminopeptidase [Candidatus Woesearchaeota archaeon]